MPKQLVHISKDQGLIWKKRWVDPAEFDPKKSVLVEGDWLRKTIYDPILLVSIVKGKLKTAPITKPYRFTYVLMNGEKIMVSANSKEEADSVCLEQLIAKGLIYRQ